MSTPAISVVMSVFNGGRYLREAVESILDQSFRDFEFIIINDGSTDNSDSVLDMYQRSDTRIRVFAQENSGLIESLNRGCALARGKYIARMDADDVSVQDRLLWQVDFMERQPDVGVLGGAVEVIDAAGRSLGISRNLLSDREIRSALLDCPFWHPTVVMRTEAFRSTGGYRKIVVDAEDHDLWLRIADRFKLANLNEVLVKYRVHPDQVSVRKCKQQVLSGLAAQAAALARWDGRPDPLDQVQEITPDLLAELGVTKMKQDAAFASKYLWRVAKYGREASYSATPGLLNEIDEILGWVQHTQTPRWVIADLRLVSAKLYLRQSRLWKAIITLGYAIWTRPMIAARPLKSLTRQLRLSATKAAAELR